MITINVNLDDGSAQFEIIGYHRGEPATRDYPGDGGEVEISDVVEIEYGDPYTPCRRVDYATAIAAIALELDITVRDAERMVEDRAFEAAAEDYADRD